MNGPTKGLRSRRRQGYRLYYIGGLEDLYCYGSVIMPDVIRL